jgi:thiol:disulfide interchange protein DsbD
MTGRLPTLEYLVILETLITLGPLMAQFTAPQAKTELVPSTTTVVAGKPFRIALHMTMEPGWHSYYLNPGESGQATSIVWHLPAGFKAGPIRWPVPERLVIGGVAGYVYEKQAWLVTDIVPPSSLSPGQTIKIGADVSWLLCREACVPQKSKLNLSLAAGAATEFNPAFAQAERSLVSAQDLPNMHAKLHKNTAILTIPAPAHGIQYFPADATFFGADLAQPQSTGQGINLVVPLSKYAPGPPKRMTGILVIATGKAKGAHWIDVKVTER